MTSHEQLLRPPPQLVAGHRRTLRHRLQLGIGDRRMHRAKTGEGAEAAVGGRHHPFATDDIGEAQQSLRHQARMFDEVADRVDDAGRQNLVVGNRACLPDFPLMRMARIGGFEHIGADARLQHHRHDGFERHIMVVRAVVVAPQMCMRTRAGSILANA